MKSNCLTFSLILFLAIGWGASQRLAAQQGGLPPEVITYADIVLYNGKILTADEKFTTAEAVAIRDGKFLAVGQSSRILPMAGPKTRKVDLQGKTVVPGFVDTHMHPFSQAWRVHQENKWNIKASPDWPNREKALEDIRRVVATAKPGETILFAQRFLPFCLPGRDLSISRKELDDIAPNNPLVTFYVVNNWAEAMNSKAAGLVQKFLKDSVFRYEGSPCVNVRVLDVVSHYFWSHIPFDEMVEVARIATSEAGRHGVTTAKEHTAVPYLTGLREVWVRGELGVRMRMPFPVYPLTGQQTVIPPEEAEKWFMSLGNLSGIGDDMFRLVGVRPSALGGNIMQGGAWTIEPKKQQLPGSWVDQPYGGSTGSYEPEIGDYVPGKGESFPGREAMIQAIRYGWDVAMDHTVGDRSVKEVLDAMEEGMKDRVIKRPGQILAMGHTPFARPEQIQKIKELGIRPGIGPWHVFTEPMIEAAFLQYGTERINQLEPFRSFLKAGIKPSLEGDTFDEPPFWKLYVAVTRKDKKYGRVWNPQETISRQEALTMSTKYGAYQLGEDSKLGSIEPGKLADLVVIDKDYLTIPEDDIPKIKALFTTVGGRISYEVEGGLK